MTADNLSQRVSELSERFKELQIKCVSDPANASEVLSDALESLQASIEELSDAEKALKESEEKFRLFIDFTYDWEAWMGPDGKYIHVSPSCKRITGYSAEEFIKNPHLSPAIAHPDDREAFEQHRNRHLNEQTGNAHIDYRIITAKGETRWISHMCQPVFGRNGEWLGRRASNRDITERKKMEAELEQLASFPKINPNPITEVDLEGRVHFLNPAAKELFPNLKESGCNHPWLTDWAQVVQIFRKSGTSTFVRDLLIDNRWYQQSMYLVPNTQAIRIYGLDITERKKAEEALRAKDTELEVILNRTPFFLTRCSRDLHYLYASRAYAQMIGRTPDQIAGKPILEIMGEDGFETIHPHIEAALRGQPVEYEAPVHFKGIGSRFLHVAYVPDKDEQGQVIGWIASILDLTDRKQAEEALQESEARYRAFITQSSEGIWRCEGDQPMPIMLSEDDQIEYFLQHAYVAECNDAYAHMYGLTKAEDIIGARSKDIFPRTDQRNIEHLRAFIRSGYRLVDNESHEIDIQGNIHYLLNSFTGIVENGYLVRAWGVQRDITQQRLMEQALQKAKDELELRVQERTADLVKANEELLKAKDAAEESVRAKAAFLANMSHELRTPLNAVIGFSSLLLSDNLTEEQKEDIERIRNGGEALLSIISDILEFSRAEKEKVKLELQPLSLKCLIEESMGMVAAQANDKGLNLAYTVSYGTPDTIIGDPGRLRQILVNLLSNAVKFTDEGDISVSVSSKVIEGNKRRITFAVSDTGIGMPQDKMDRLFQPFTQLEYTLSRKRDGAGLGLAICKELVELMGGEIWAESEEGKGSTFRFTIQAETISGKQLDLDQKDRAVAYENISPQKPLSILVAEDNPSNQKVLVEMLKRLGYRPDAVADGCEVLQALQIRPYDLIFMDIRMPEMDGLTATREIRKLWPDNGPKVVAITAFAMDGDQEKCFEAGMDGYIAKPVKLDDLATLLRNITAPTPE